MKIAAIIAVAGALALGGCGFQVPHKHHVVNNDVQVRGELVPAPKTQVIARPTLESLDARVTELERRLNAARAYRERIARQRAAQPVQQ